MLGLSPKALSSITSSAKLPGYLTLILTHIQHSKSFLQHSHPRIYLALLLVQRACSSGPSCAYDSLEDSYRRASSPRTSRRRWQIYILQELSKNLEEEVD